MITHWFHMVEDRPSPDNVAFVWSYQAGDQPAGAIIMWLGDCPSWQAYPSLAALAEVHHVAARGEDRRYLVAQGFPPSEEYTRISDSIRVAAMQDPRKSWQALTGSGGP